MFDIYARRAHIVFIETDTTEQTMFKVLAQSFTTTQRIAKTLRETSEAEVTRLVSGELEVAGFYIISITAV